MSTTSFDWKGKGGMVRVDGWEVKLCNPLTTRAMPERFYDEIFS